MKPESKVTIAIPTYNRSELLKASLESALAQDYRDYQVLVLDNASNDDTEALVRSFADPRITYVRHETNVGMFRNWQLAVELNSSPYLSVLSDDAQVRVHQLVRINAIGPNAKRFSGRVHSL